MVFSEPASTRTIESKAGPLRLREFLPSTGQPRGVYLHLHGGGWVIGGESAGAHLSAVTLLRLRQRLGHCPFSGANFNFGLFDMNLTPSARAFGDERLFLRTMDMVQFRAAFLPGEQNLRDPDISPLYGDLQNLCPALFTVGTRDALLDDSLFMHARWLTAGNQGQLDVYLGAPHAFFRLGDAHTQSAMTQQIQFICSQLK